MTIIVCPLSHVDAVIAERAPSHLITLLSPGAGIDTPAGVGTERHLNLSVNDICEPRDDLVCPDEALVRRIIGFGQGWNAGQPLLVHCWAGVSRSTATAYTLACERNPDTPEAVIAEAIRRASASAQPNRLIVALADDILGRGGRMVDAVDAMGPGKITLESRPFDIAARFG